MEFEITSQILFNWDFGIWKCDSCQSSIETQDHVLWCLSYSTIREDKDISNDNDLANYLKQVLIIRDKLNLTK